VLNFDFIMTFLAKCIQNAFVIFRILIRHNHSQQPVVPPPTFENWLCGLQRGCGSHNWHHVCQLGKPHYHHQDGIISSWLRQTCDEVRAYTMPWPCRDRQRLQEAALLLERDSVHSASTQAFTKWAISSIMHGQNYLFNITLL
jgi:hypothetical protein